MKIIADTNVLLRDALGDDPHQARVAGRILQSADLIAVPVAVLCEFAWVLRQGYRKSPAEVGYAIRKLVDSENVVTSRLAVDAGLGLLDNGGDFADGAIAFEGASLGAEEFVSFDKKAVSLLQSQGHRARLLA